MPRILVTFSCALAVVTAACSKDRAPAAAPPSAPVSTAPPPSSPRPSRAPVQIEMKNVRLHADEGIVLEVRHLRGEMVSRDAGGPPVFDDQRSYVLRVHTAEVALDMPSLTNLMNHHIFAYEDAPLRDITVEIDEGQLKLKAKLHKGVTVPISMKADVLATPDGRLQLKTDKVSALSVPAKKLMDLFGLKLDEVVSLKERRGIEIQDNDVIIAPGQVLPPPEIQGRLSRVAIVNRRLEQTFVSERGTSPARLSPPDAASPNYVYFSGSDIRFGKLTMSGADLQLIDSDPKDAFDFFPAQYKRQLVAGYSKNTPSGGLKTYMPDYSDLDRVKDLKPRAK
ncbi:MAG TPA: hypothetical protein VF424_02330 [Vicinamibacterales bacterium]